MSEAVFLMHIKLRNTVAQLIQIDIIGYKLICILPLFRRHLFYIVRAVTGAHYHA